MPLRSSLTDDNGSLTGPGQAISAASPRERPEAHHACRRAAVVPAVLARLTSVTRVLSVDYRKKRVEAIKAQAGRSAVALALCFQGGWDPPQAGSRSPWVRGTVGV